MESVSEYIRQGQEVDRYYFDEIDEDVLLQKLRNDLDNGSDIDSFIPQKNFNGCTYLGTILHFSTWYWLEQVVEYALTRGANIALKRTSEKVKSRYRNGLEIAARKYNQGSDAQSRIFEMLKTRSLELYSSFGLTSFHIDCAVHMQRWSDETTQGLQTADVNATISTESPLWPGMTPLLIAAKFENHALVTQLLDLGANPLVRDPKGNNPLHYATCPVFYDERLFALDGRNTFGAFIGCSHFHFACQHCPKALGIVQRYLDQGIPPDSPIRNLGCEVVNYGAGKAGLHIAADKNCQELARLLLEYGAKVNQEDSRGRTPINSISYYSVDSMSFRGLPVPILCTLIEAGSDQESIRIEGLVHATQYCRMENKLLFLTCVKKLTILSESLISNLLKDRYLQILTEFDDWDESEYADRCAEELKVLTDLGLRQILDDTAIVKHDFKEKFGSFNSLDIGSYPIYGSLLSLRFKQKLLQYEKKRRFSQAVRLLQWLFLNQGHLPCLCAETVICYLSDQEIIQFLSQ